MIKFANRLWQAVDSRYTKKALKILIKDDLNGHYNWVAQVTDLMKQYELTDYDIPSAKIKNNVVENFRKKST